MIMPTKRYHLTVHGRVQGVFFRKHVKEKADKLGVKGYVRNCPDGKSVEVVAEGEEQQLKELLKFCKIGPTASKVDHVDFDETEFENAFGEFVIRY